MSVATLCCLDGHGPIRTPIGPDDYGFTVIDRACAGVIPAVRSSTPADLHYLEKEGAKMLDAVEIAAEAEFPVAVH